MSSNVHLQIGYTSDVGPVRQRNEDVLVVGAEVLSGPHLGPGLLVTDCSAPTGCSVVDGLGGHEGGLEAAQLIGEMLAKWPVAGQEAMASHLREIDRQLPLRLPAFPRAGAALAGVVVGDGGCWVFSVGDCCVYRVTDGCFRRETRKDTLRGRVGPRFGDDEDDPRRSQDHVLTQALGGGPRSFPLDPFVQEIRPHRTDHFLVCSDGLNGVMPLSEMETIVATAASPREAVTRLVGAAVSAGGQDNVSAIDLRITR